MNRMLITVALAGGGFFFLGSGFQSFTVIGVSNVFGQYCGAPICVHPEWIALGGCLLVAAFLFYRHRAQQVPQPPDTDIELMGKSKRVSRRSDKQ